MPFQDKTLICSDCGQPFTFTADDQEFFASRGYSTPKRCRSCRASRRNDTEGGMGRAPRPEREMFDAVCASCGQATQVPFQPRGDRPVYCRDCFARQGGGARPSYGRGR